MREFDSIQDYIQHYLNGKLSKEEILAFEQLMKEDDLLKKEVEFYSLIQEGLSKKNLTKYASEKKQLIGSKRLYVFILLLATLACFIFIIPFIKSTILNQNIIEVDNVSISEDLVIQLGGESTDIFGNYSSGISLSKDGYLGLVGRYQGQLKINNDRIGSSENSSKSFLALGNENLEFFRVLSFEGKGSNSEITSIQFDLNNHLVVGGSISDSTTIRDSLVKASGSDDLGYRDFFIAKFNQELKLDWIVNRGGERIDHLHTGVNRVNAIAIDSIGDIFFVTSYINEILWNQEILPSGGPNESLLISKLSQTGNIKWQNTITSNYKVEAKDIKVDHKGNCFIAGTFGHHNLGGRLYFGRDSLISKGGRDIFTAKFDNSGRISWIKQAGSDQKQDGFDEATSICLDNNNQIVIAGFFTSTAQFGEIDLSSHGGRDIFIAKYDQMGNCLWVKGFGSSNSDNKSSVDVGWDIVTDMENNIYCTGAFKHGNAIFGDKILKAQGESDAFLLKLNDNGQLIWVKQIGSTTNLINAEAGTALAIDNDGFINIIGLFAGELILENTSVKSSGINDLFITKVSPEGRIKKISHKALFVQK